MEQDASAEKGSRPSRPTRQYQMLSNNVAATLQTVKVWAPSRPRLGAVMPSHSTSNPNRQATPKPHSRMAAVTRVSTWKNWGRGRVPSAAMVR